MRILCFGDSNTYGYDPRGFFGDRYNAEDRWTDLLAKQIGWDIINLGANGREIPRGHAQLHLLAEYTPADADSQTGATTEEVIQMWNEAMDYSGTLKQKRAHLFCSMMKVNYEKLSMEDQKAMERISQKSPLFVSAISQRGKAIPTPSHGKGKSKRK